MKTFGLRVAAAVLALALGTVPLAADDSLMMNDDEKALSEIEDQVVTLQVELSAARRRGDDEKKVEKMQKKFDDLQKKRVELLRRTWQM